MHPPQSEASALSLSSFLRLSNDVQEPPWNEDDFLRRAGHEPGDCWISQCRHHRRILRKVARHRDARAHFPIDLHDELDGILYRERGVEARPRRVEHASRSARLLPQLLGYVRRDIAEDAAVVAALADPTVARFVAGAPKKIIFVPGRLLNIVA